ncbi:MAG: hypothetical protein LBR21_08175 [Propionibacteriaceae bacterium]|nr:hypothetical protein [Propionibacteriaceae bacterium]
MTRYRVATASAVIVLALGLALLAPAAINAAGYSKEAAPTSQPVKAADSLTNQTRSAR